MRLFAKKWWERVGWGAPTSVALHLIVAFLLLFDLPLELPKPPKEQTVNVELVPPPQAKEEKKAEQKKAEQKKGEQPKPQPKPKPQLKPQPQPKPQPKPAQQLPQSFASAMAKTKQDNKEAELPPAAQRAEKKPDASEQVKAVSESAKAVDEPAKVPPKKDETPVKEQKPLPTLAVPAKSPDNATAKSDAKPMATVTEAKPEPKDTKSAEAKQQTEKQPEEKPKTKPADAAAKVELKPVPSKLVEAKVLYSEKAIADPRFKQALLKLPVKVRIRQICTAEALEQIRNQRPNTPPEGLVPFGPRGGFIFDNRMEASGGAYHNKSNWYDVDFKCLVNEDATELVSFSIAIGNIVPKATWEKRRLRPPPS